ncbi:MAG: hypothetical protein ACOC0N_00430 [Chroococcales cyanobacterium]
MSYLPKNLIFKSFAQTLLFLSLTTGVAVAELPEMEMPMSSVEEAPEFQKIEQPVGVKVAVTLIGLGLIGLELWWFIYSKPKAKQKIQNQ